MSKSISIFNNSIEDFLKIFAPTIIVFFLIFKSDYLMTPLFLIFVTYFCDSGHVYSTFLEIYFDPKENRKKHIWIITFISFALNLGLLFLSENLFYHYIFYFTVFHNMRQGLGISFLYLNQKISPLLIKTLYYFLTMFPFVLFHLTRVRNVTKLDENYYRPLNYFLIDHYYLRQKILMYGIGIYSLIFVGILIFLYRKELYKTMWSMFFFGAVYGFAYLYFENELKAYAILIISHAIPYYFLFQKRIELTHSVNHFKKFSYFYVFLLFFIGAMVDINQGGIVRAHEDIEYLLLAIFNTPLITHFLIDGIIWKHTDEKFQILKSHFKITTN